MGKLAPSRAQSRDLGDGGFESQATGIGRWGSGESRSKGRGAGEVAREVPLQPLAGFPCPGCWETAPPPQEPGPQNQGAQGWSREQGKGFWSQVRPVQAPQGQQPLNATTCLQAHPTATPTATCAATHTLSHSHPLHTHRGLRATALDPHPGPLECLWCRTQRVGLLRCY